MENFFGAWGCCRFEQRQKRRALSSTFEFEFDGHQEVRETLSWETLSGLFLSGGLRDWSTWWATTCHILREYPGFLDLTWVGPGFSWQLSFDKRGEPIARFIETAGGAHLHVVSIKVRHRLFGSADALELRHLFLKHEKLLCDLNGSPNRIAILRGKDDFSLRDSLRFDGEIDEPFSLAIMHSRRNFIEFELNRRPIRVHNPLPCCIYVFGSRLRSDLAKNIRVPEELVAGIYRICAPYVHEALSIFCRETATHGSLQEHFSVFLTGSEQNRPGSVHQSAGRWSMDRRSVDIIEQFALVECHGCEPMSVRAVRDFWKGRVLLSAHSFGKIVPTYLRHLPWVDRSNPHAQAMLKFRFADTFVFEC